MKVSIIIPTLNEEAAIATCLASIRQAFPEDEVLVADGGSRDRTLELAAGLATVVGAPLGRAMQMNAGARGAKGDVLLFLHADCRIGPDARRRMVEALGDGSVVGGSFKQKIDGSGWLYRLLENGAQLRSRLLKIFYGDTGMFIRRDLFERLGGFPPRLVMEEVAISRAMRRAGRVRVLDEHVVVSPRRWQAGGVIRVTARNLLITLLYALGMSDRNLAAIAGRPLPKMVDTPTQGGRIASDQQPFTPGD